MTSSEGCRSLPLLSLREKVLFPGAVKYMSIDSPSSLAMLASLPAKGACVLTGTQKHVRVERPVGGDHFDVCVEGEVLRIHNTADNGAMVVLRGIERRRITGFVQENPFPVATYEPLAEIRKDSSTVDTLGVAVYAAAKQLVAISPDIPDKASHLLDQIKDPARLGDIVADMVEVDLSDKERACLLIEVDLVKRLRRLLALLQREVKQVEAELKVVPNIHVEIARDGKVLRAGVLPLSVVRIGRALSNDIRIDDPSLGEHHAEIVARPPGQVEIVDLQSGCNTVSDGKRISRTGFGGWHEVELGHFNVKVHARSPRTRGRQLASVLPHVLVMIVWAVGMVFAARFALRFWSARWLYVALAAAGLLGTHALVKLADLVQALPKVPRYVRGQLAYNVALGLMVLRYFLVTDGPSRYLGGVILLWCGYRVLAALLLSAQVSHVLRSLRRSFAGNEEPRINYPYVMVLDSGRILQGKRLIPRLVATLWKNYNAHDSERELRDLLARIENSAGASLGKFFVFLRRVLSISLPKLVGGGQLVAFVSARDLRREPAPFLNYLSRHAAACIAIPSAMGTIYRALVGLRQSGAAENIVEGAFERPLDDRLFDFFGRVNAWADRAEGDLAATMHLSPGPTVILDATQDQLLYLRGLEPGFSEMRIGYEVLQGATTRSCVPQIVNAIGGSALPMFRSDRNLPPELRRVVPALAEKGLAPLADAYLRLRLAKSDVERFLCIFDCFEVMIRYSAAVLLVAHYGERWLDDATMSNMLERPTLGGWMGLLQNLVGRKLGAAEGILGRAVVDFWKAPLQAPAVELIDTVNGSGLTWDKEIPRSHLGWLVWLTWLRNTTKGHGGIDEAAVAPLWHHFHVALLQAISDLSPLSLAASLVACDGAGHELQLRGWLRGGCRTSTLDELGIPRTEEWSVVKLVHGQAVFTVSPFAVVRGVVCLTWNRRDGGAVQYIDYRTGRFEESEIAVAASEVARGSPAERA